MTWAWEKELPIKVESVANQATATRGGRMAAARKAKRQREETTLTLLARGRPPGEAWTITLTRVAPRRLDDDNLARALKAIRDGVADYLLPANRGNKVRRWADDSDGRITWRYDQTRGAPKTYAVRIRIEVREAEAA